MYFLFCRNISHNICHYHKIHIIRDGGFCAFYQSYVRRKLGICKILVASYCTMVYVTCNITKKKKVDGIKKHD